MGTNIWKICVLRAEILAKTRLKMQNFLNLYGGGHMSDTLMVNLGTADWPEKRVMTAAHRGKLGNGEHLSFEAYKYKVNIIYVIIIMLHKEHINFYPETHFYRHNCCRFEVMAHKRRWRRSAITCIAGGKCERIYMCNGCVRLPNFDLLIISLFMERILFVSY